MLHIEIMEGFIRCIFTGEAPGIGRKVQEQIEETMVNRRQ